MFFALLSSWRQRSLWLAAIVNRSVHILKRKCIYHIGRWLLLKIWVGTFDSMRGYLEVLSVVLIDICLLMDKTKPIIVVKLGDCKVNFNFIFEFGILIDGFNQCLGESSDNTLFIVVYYILEEFVYKLDLKVGQIEACVIIWVKLISNVKHDLVFLWLHARLYKVIN